MTTWRCASEDCKFAPCLAEMRNGVCPTCCPAGLYGHLSQWEKIADEQEQKQETALPKLTAEVFDRPDCPGWARYAAVNDNGTAAYFENEPEYDGYLGCWLRTDKLADIIKDKFDASDWQNSLIVRLVKPLPKLTAAVFDRPDCPKSALYATVDEDGTAYFHLFAPVLYTDKWQHTNCCKKIPGEWDAANWKNSLIERPVKSLPDWCKVGEWGYDTAEECYFEVVDITQFNVDVAYIDKAWRYTIGRNVFDDRYRPARMRPYNAEEMEALVGKTLKHDGKSSLGIVYLEDGFLRVGVNWASAKQLIEEGYTIDGKPCGVLEHLEDVEWVQ